VGALSLTLTGPIYIDANILIYSVERVVPYADILEAFWRQVSAEHIVVVTSELTALETLVGPLKAGDQALEARFRQALFATPDLRLRPITLSILEHAARLRATYAGLKIPDAIHAATAVEASCAMLLTNDLALRQITVLTVRAPHDLFSPS
jgi:predicted nucleic acid-binding protein